MNILLLGPSCVGKTTLIKKFSDVGFNWIKSYTTRQPRENEEDYFFVTEDEFNSFNDWADRSIHLNNHYGIRKNQFIDGKHNILTTNLVGIDNLKNYVDEIIVLLPYDYNEMEERILRKRENAELRVKLAKEEIEYYENNNIGKKYYVYVVEDLDKIVNEYIIKML